MTVEYLKNENIDKRKWDFCIDNAANGLIYGKSFFLDSMCVNWDGVVVGDYEAVMPLTWKKKWGIPYLYQPAFLQQGGIFFKTELSEDTIYLLFSKAFKHFKFAEIAGNFLKFPISPLLKIEIKNRNNFILDLNHDYAILYDKYTFSCKRNLKKIEKLELNYLCSDDFLGTIELYKKLYQSRLPNLLNTDYENIKKVFKELSQNNNLITRQVYNKNNELLCAVILLKHGKRIYNIMNAIPLPGKHLKANYFLFDRIFHEFCGQSLIFDFEGSDIAGIADFYLRFNPKNEPYSFLKYNNLNPIFKLLKP